MSEDKPKKVVYVSSMGRSPEPVNVEGGDSVRDVLSRAGVTRGSASVVLENKEISNLDTKVQPGQTLYLVPKVSLGIAGVVPDVTLLF